MTKAMSLDARLALLLAFLVLVNTAVGLALARWLGLGTLAAMSTLLVMAPLSILAARWWTQPVLAVFRALSGSVSRFRDADYSFTLHHSVADELGELVAAHNRLAETLREERQGLVQRELLLETVMQNTPVALMLTEASGVVVYANIAARQILFEGKRLEGVNLDHLIAAGPPALRDAWAAQADQLLTFEQDDGEETFHLARRGFRLNGQPHTLHLLRRLTREIARQEVATWKKVIRVISHELNNSLGPISSMAHSGGQLLSRGELARLPRVFEAIEERARHLDRFVRGYARFAKLPNPTLEPVDWVGFVDRLQAQVAFTVAGDLPTRPGHFDAAQLEQVLINLFKNAHEAGSPADAVTLSIREDHGGGMRLEIADRGSGMSEAVLQQALLPFYSTKRTPGGSGTGLGLALAREIVEAHGGQISLANRNGGGLAVVLTLPPGR
jgi:nitrogen fixation/metabolism regulation signal transduction histidine kinase